MSLLRADYTFDHPQMGRSSRPLVVLRGSDATFIKDLMSIMKAYGLPLVRFKDPFILRASRSNGDFNLVARLIAKVRNEGWDFKELIEAESAAPIQTVLNLLPAVGLNPVPDQFLGLWWEPHLILSPTMRQDGAPDFKPRPDISHVITNIDPQLVNQYGKIYLAIVLTGLRDQVEAELASMNFTDALHFAFKMNEDRQKFGLAITEEISADAFFETYSMAIPATRPAVAAILKELGGREFRAPARFFGGNMMKSGYRDDVEDISVEMEMRSIPFFEFRTRELREIEKRFPFIKRSARPALYPESHRSRIRRYFSPIM